MIDHRVEAIGQIRVRTGFMRLHPFVELALGQGIDDAAEALSDTRMGLFQFNAVGFIALAKLLAETVRELDIDVEQDRLDSGDDVIGEFGAVAAVREKAEASRALGRQLADDSLENHCMPADRPAGLEADALADIAEDDGAIRIQTVETSVGEDGPMSDFQFLKAIDLARGGEEARGLGLNFEFTEVFGKRGACFRFDQRTHGAQTCAIGFIHPDQAKARLKTGKSCRIPRRLVGLRHVVPRFCSVRLGFRTDPLPECGDDPPSGALL